MVPEPTQEKGTTVGLFRHMVYRAANKRIKVPSMGSTNKQTMIVATIIMVFIGTAFIANLPGPAATGVFVAFTVVLSINWLKWKASNRN